MKLGQEEPKETQEDPSVSAQWKKRTEPSKILIFGQVLKMEADRLLETLINVFQSYTIGIISAWSKTPDIETFSKTPKRISTMDR